MGRILRYMGAGPCDKYATNEALFDGLCRLEGEAIQCVGLKAGPAIRRAVKQLGLADDLAEDVLSEALCIFITKIQDGNYSFEGHSPATYLAEIARRVAQNYTRTHKGKRAVELGEQHLAQLDDDHDGYLRQKENSDMVAQLLSKLGPPCSHLIRLKYIDGYSDEEVVARQLANYSSTESLKTTRSQCMKKLRELAKAHFK